MDKSFRDSRRDFLRTVIAGSAGLVSGCGVYGKREEFQGVRENLEKRISFEDAQANPELRGKYVTQVVEEMGKLPGYVKSIEYVSDEKAMEMEKKQGIGWKNIPMTTLVGIEGNASEIFIYNPAFESELIESELAFDLRLKKREMRYAHRAKDLLAELGLETADFTRIGAELNPELLLFNALLYTDGYANEIRDPRFFELSKVYQSCVGDQFVKYYMELWDIQVSEAAKAKAIRPYKNVARKIGRVNKGRAAFGEEGEFLMVGVLGWWRSYEFPPE